MTDPASAVFEGAISVRAVLDTNSRPLHVIHIAHHVVPRHARLLGAAHRRGVPVRIGTRAGLDRLAAGRTHGGVVAVVGPRRPVPPSALVSVPAPFLAMLDGVEDPYQLGQSVRALYAAGAHGLLLPRRDLGPADATVARASAGASERLPVAEVDDPPAAVDALRRLGLRVVGARQRNADCADTTDLTDALLLVIGGGRRGIRSAVAALADTWVRVPYGRGFAAALDTTSATAALAFEAARQRRTAHLVPRRGPPGVVAS